MSEPSERTSGVVVYSDAVPGGPPGKEIEERVAYRWFLEKRMHAVLGEDGMPRPVVEGEPSAWMQMGTVYDDEDRAMATWTFHREKYPEGGHRLVRAETRFYVEDCDE